MVALFKDYITRIFLLAYSKELLKTMKNGVYFIMIALLVAVLLEILIYAN